MNKPVRTVLSVISAFGLVGSLAVSTPSRAADALVSASGATMPLASTLMIAVTAPVLALDTDVFSDEQAPVASETPVPADEAPAPVPATLAALVAYHETAATVDAEQDCLATSVYFESKGEPLTGQLAVAETVLNRAGSGRFASSICGVVRQPGQFSFVRGGKLPEPARGTRAWRQAVAVARIAQGDLWREVVPAALYFHAARVRPGFGGKRIAQLGNHIFYR